MVVRSLKKTQVRVKVEKVMATVITVVGVMEEAAFRIKRFTDLLRSGANASEIIIICRQLQLKLKKRAICHMISTLDHEAIILEVTPSL